MRCCCYGFVAVVAVAVVCVAVVAVAVVAVAVVVMVSVEEAIISSNLLK